MIHLDYRTQTLHSSHLRFPVEESLYMQLSQNVLYNAETGSTTTQLNLLWDLTVAFLRTVTMPRVNILIIGAGEL